MLCGFEGPGVNVNAHASEYAFDSEANVIQVHKYCTEWAIFRFALPAWNLCTHEDKVEPDLSLVRDPFSVL